MQFKDSNGNSISDFQVIYEDGKEESFTLEGMFSKIKELNAESSTRRKSLASLKEQYALLGDVSPADVPKLMVELKTAQGKNMTLQGQINDTAMLEAFRADETVQAMIYPPEHAVKVFGDKFKVEDGKVLSTDGKSMADAMQEMIETDPHSTSYLRASNSGGNAFGAGSKVVGTNTNTAKAVETGNLKEFRKAKAS